MSFSHARLTFSHAGIAPRIAIRAGHAYIADMKKIGFLSFGHWTPSPQSQARSAADVLLQSIDLAVAAEQLGADGAYFRVHHFARQLASPFPLLAAVGAGQAAVELLVRSIVGRQGSGGEAAFGHVVAYPSRVTVSTTAAMRSASA